ncbi:hypothetical protein EMUCRT_0810 [Ehrlichia cf. muris str. EmCRT]|uniref:Uncharacterized protein n=1 Tax=Ehrlichia cf. muris str. EmCRT TaxID=1359167 RepID=A0A0F3N6K2_9RICK|nr:hypothetical protein EMUCRT_0810 [Ehrlichia cf. muris str. EmCRT]
MYVFFCFDYGIEVISNKDLIVMEYIRHSLYILSVLHE